MGLLDLVNWNNLSAIATMVVEVKPMAPNELDYEFKNLHFITVKVKVKINKVALLRSKIGLYIAKFGFWISGLNYTVEIGK